MSTADDVGGRLRRLRRKRGLSLQDLERASNGRLKAAMIGSYERGDRNISAARLLELAEFYGVAASDLLPTEALAGLAPQKAGMVIDLQKLTVTGSHWEAVRRYVEAVQIQRGDHNPTMLSVRGDDVRAMAIMMGTTPEGLVEMLRETQMLVA